MKNVLFFILIFYIVKIIIKIVLLLYYKNSSIEGIYINEYISFNKKEKGLIQFRCIKIKIFFKGKIRKRNFRNIILFQIILKIILI